MKNRGWKMINDVNTEKKKKKRELPELRSLNSALPFLLMCVSKKQEILKIYK